MSLNAVVTPSGRLRTEVDPETSEALSTELANALQEAFSRSSADGLLLLASAELSQKLPAAFAYWRQLARALFQVVCQLGDGDFAKWKRLPPPPDDQLIQLVADAPPMRGLDYLEPAVLATLWGELRDLVVERAAKAAGGPAAFLQSINPLWHLVGRVTFHLAENKRDAERPFAFLATYSHRLSDQARPVHLPLAEALKAYAGAKERSKLESLLEPVRRAAESSTFIRELLDGKALFSPQAWTIRQAYRFLTESPLIEQAGVVVRVPDWWSARRPPRAQVQVQIGGNPASAIGMDGLLDFDVQLALDGEPLTAGEKRQLLSSTDGLVLLRGKWVEADPRRLQEALEHWRQLEESHPDGISFVEGMRLLSGAQVGLEEALDEGVIAWSRVTSGNWLRQTLERMRSPDQVNNFQPGRDLCGTLRPYQADGVRWLWFMTELGLGACLADDMGLGKTVQVIDLLLHRRRQFGNQSRRPSLLVVPASLIGNWRQELAKFGPQLTVFFAHRSETAADEIESVAGNPQRAIANFDLVVTSYALVRRQDWLSRMEWSLVVLDEAQAIKNAASAQAKSIKKLPAVGRIVLTGTPVENHLGDLWSIFDFCCPGLLGTAGQFKKFVKELNKRPDAQGFAALRRLVRPYILRRLKTDSAIVPDLPDKMEMRVECGLSKKQAALYQRAIEELAEKLDRAEGIARRGLVLSVLMQLKQICNHPAQYLTGASFGPQESGKFERLALLCEPIIERQEKMLIFTQFQSLTQPLADYLATLYGRSGIVLHGGTPVRKRSELVRTFQSDGGPPFFVISLKAGGTGLNLTAATHVVHFDRWWNPAVENQATDRAFRIGQKRNVLVHKFVCRGTVEERIDAMIQSKQAVSDRILSQESETQLTEMSDDELMRFVSLDISRATTEE